MKNQTWIKLLAPAFIASLTLTGCPSDDDGTDEVGETGTATDTTGDTTAESGDMSTTATTTVDDTTTDTTAGDTTTDTTTGELPDPFIFATDDPAAYTRVDRKGMPAIATAVITSKDEYNAANPSDDAAGTFVDEITANLSGLHMALNDDLMAYGLTPCLVVGCVGQAAPLVVPDTLKIDLTGEAGFPNGRRLIDPVIDVTLAVVMLDLGAHSVTTFADLPLNPAANDVEFLAEFPYLADPN